MADKADAVLLIALYIEPRKLPVRRRTTARLPQPLPELSEVLDEATIPELNSNRAMWASTTHDSEAITIVGQSHYTAAHGTKLS